MAGRDGTCVCVSQPYPFSRELERKPSLGDIGHPKQCPSGKNLNLDLFTILESLKVKMAG